MWVLMSSTGPEVLVGEHCHTTKGGLRCEVLAILQDTGRVRVRFDDGTESETAPAVIGCYLLSRKHPGEA